jgi:Bacterial Ig-like domain (group 2)
MVVRWTNGVPCTMTRGPAEICWSIVLCLVTWLGPFSAVPSWARESETVPAEKAVAELEKFEAIIAERLKVADSLYDHQNAGRTMTAAFANAGISPEVTQLYAVTWGGWLGSDYFSGRSQVYSYHLDALISSIEHVGAQGFARADDLKAISKGMDDWAAFEPTFLALVASDVELQVGQASLAETQRRIDPGQCGNDNGCRQALAAAARALQDAYTAGSNRYSANADAIRNTKAHFFSPIGACNAARPAGACGETLACTGMELRFFPTEITRNAFAMGSAKFTPDDCRPPERSKFAVVDTTGPIEVTLASAGRFAIFALLANNAAGTAVVEATAGDLKASATLVAKALPDCRAITFASRPGVNRLHVRDLNLLQVALLPENCALVTRSVRFSSSNESVARVDPEEEKAVRSASVAVYGLAEGKATIKAVTAGLEPALLSLTVVNDGDACQGMVVDYHHPLDDQVAVRQGANTPAPKVAYRPWPCRIPAGNPTFESRDRAKLTVDRASGIATGVNLGTAEIVARHGDLKEAIASITVVRKPDCDEAMLTYANAPLSPGGKDTALVEYYSVKDGLLSDEGNCYWPNETAYYASSDSEKVVVAADGSIRAVSVGSAVIKLTVGGIEASREVEVVAK